MCIRDRLVIVRIIQGMAYGAEWGGAILMTYEHTAWDEKGKYTGWVQAGFPVGLLIANLVFLVSVNLPGDWAWRVPFPVSYTHLDVYKRQGAHPIAGEHRRGQADLPFRQGQQILLGEATARHDGHREVEAAACLLYTSRCV